MEHGDGMYMSMIGVTVVFFFKFFYFARVDRDQPRSFLFSPFSLGISLLKLLALD